MIATKTGYPLDVVSIVWISKVLGPQKDEETVAD
jgi:hypothetical protein